jgi:hypothetical protein
MVQHGKSKGSSVSSMLPRYSIPIHSIPLQSSPFLSYQVLITLITSSSILLYSVLGTLRAALIRIVFLHLLPSHPSTGIMLAKLSTVAAAVLLYTLAAAVPNNPPCA